MGPRGTDSILKKNLKNIRDHYSLNELEDINQFFEGQKFTISQDNITYEFVDAGEYAKLKSLAFYRGCEITVPQNDNIYLYTSKRYECPRLHVYGKLISGNVLSFGLGPPIAEYSGLPIAEYSGLGRLHLYYENTTNLLSGMAQILPRSDININIENAFDFVASRNTLEFYHNYQLKHVVVFTDDGTADSGEILGETPYSIHIHPNLPPRKMKVSFLMMATSEPLVFHMYGLNIDEKQDTRTKTYYLYVENTNTKFEGSTIGNVTSHPIPIAGYSSKTLAFQANKNGNLIIYGYMGSNVWVVYDSIPYSANEMITYTVSEEYPLIKVEYQTQENASIQVARVLLR